MEQAFRVLKKSLEKDPRIKRVRHNYYGFSVVWNNAIRDILHINRKYYGKRIRSKRKHFLWVIADVRWWDQICENKTVTRFYKYDVSELEINENDYFNLSRWSFNEFDKLQFFDRYMFVHQLLDFISKNGWKPYQYPDDILRLNYQSIIDESLDSHKRRNGYRLSKNNFRNKDRPGDLILEHFMPNGHYNIGSIKLIYNFKHKYTIHKWYKAIMRIIRKNRNFKRNGVNKIIDFDYKNIIKHIKVSDYREKYFKSCKFRPVSLYRSIINDLELNGKSFFDFEPRYGEKFLAATAQECSYYFRPTCPFDTYYKKLADFINYDNISEDDELTQYDFAIVDFDFKFNMVNFEYYMANYFKRVDTNIIFVDNNHVEEVMKKYPPFKKIPMRVCTSPAMNGYLFIYN